MTILKQKILSIGKNLLFYYLRNSSIVFKKDMNQDLKKPPKNLGFSGVVNSLCRSSLDKIIISWRTEAHVLQP